MAELGRTQNDPRYYVSLAESRNDETVANMAIILIKQTILLTQRYIERITENFAHEGGFKEKMTHVRLSVRDRR